MIAEISPITTKLPFGKSQLFSYSVPEEMESEIKPGSVVEMPLGTRVVSGVVFSILPPCRRGGLRGGGSAFAEGKLKPISRIIPNIQLNQYQLDLAMWMHKFYHAPLGIILKFIIPDLPKKGNINNSKSGIKYQVLSIKQVAKNNEQKAKISANTKYLILNTSQIDRFNKYVELIKKYKKQNRPAQSATRTEAGRQILILVPQIIDVETLYIRFGAIFNEGGHISPAPLQMRIGKLHSQLNMTEYYNNWARFQAGEIDVMIGTRQAVLSPPSNLGLIIIDEFNDDNFNQSDQTPRFGAVEIAKKVCGMTDAKLVLGGSTPNLGAPIVETRLIASLQSGRGDIVDTQNEYYGKNFSPLSNKLQDLLQEAVQNKKWGLVLVNRRGESAFVVCKDCGNVIKCPKCDIPLVLHAGSGVGTGRDLSLRCHRCAYKTPPPEKCPACQSHKIKYSSPGTQGIEKEILDLPSFGRRGLGGGSSEEGNIIRIDSDSLKTKKGLSEILKNLQKESGIIVATQVASKIWLPKEIDIIGLLYADSFLNRPDFRASEKTFQIISELKGRLSENGKIIIQTFNPENKILNWAAAGDFESFCKNELAVRKQFNYPPFARIIKLSLAGRDMRKVLQETDRMKKSVLPQFKNIEILGPMPMENAKRGLFGKTLILKISDWNEEIHLKLMGMIPDEWTVE